MDSPIFYGGIFRSIGGSVMDSDGNTVLGIASVGATIAATGDSSVVAGVAEDSSSIQVTGKAAFGGGFAENTGSILISGIGAFGYGYMDGTGKVIISGDGAAGIVYAKTGKTATIAGDGCIMIGGALNFDSTITDTVVNCHVLGMDNNINSTIVAGNCVIVGYNNTISGLALLSNVIIGDGNTSSQSGAHIIGTGLTNNTGKSLLLGVDYEAINCGVNGTATAAVLGLLGATPVVQASAIASPDTSGAQLKTAVDLLRTALINIGITA